MPGSRGPTGEKGEPGEKGNDYVDLVKSNWKQCVWKREDEKDSGLIQVLDLEIQNYQYWTYTLVNSARNQWQEFSPLRCGGWGGGAMLH